MENLAVEGIVNMLQNPNHFWVIHMRMKEKMKYLMEKNHKPENFKIFMRKCLYTDLVSRSRQVVVVIVARS